MARRPRPARGWRLVLAAAALVGVVAIDLYQSRGLTSDLLARYAAGELVAEGESPYDEPALVARAERHTSGDGLPFYDAPPMAAAFRPLTLLPPRAVAVTLLATSVAACAVIARFIVGAEDRGRWALVGFGLLVFSPARHALSLVQLDLVALALALLIGAVQPVVGLAKPQTVGPTVAALFGRRASREPVRAVVVATAGAAVVLAASAALAPDATWLDWAGAVRDRSGTPSAPEVTMFAAGLAVLGWGLAGVRRGGARVDPVCVTAAAGCLLAVMGGWNPQWFLALALPLGAILVAADRGHVVLRRHEQVVLGLVAAASTGDAFVAYSLFGTFQAWVPILLVVLFFAALVLLGHLAWWLVPPLVGLNAVIVLAELSTDQRVGLAMAVAVALLYLTFSVRPPAIGWPSTRQVVR